MPTIDIGGVTLHYTDEGSGEPVVLLHGFPHSAELWTPQRAALGGNYRVIAPDLRGYGRSSKPPTDEEHRPYSKRAVAGDVRALMRLLGHERFAVVGHDRGSYVALRLALDAPGVVTHLAVVDCIPIVEHLERCDARFATAWWHWFFFAQPDKPERAIGADPDAWYGGDPAVMGEENHADFRRAVHDPDTVRAMLEDYRAGLTVDCAAEEADRAAGRRVACPTLVLWSARDDLEELHGDPRVIWADWTNDLRGGRRIDSGHHMAEEAPGELAAALVPFLATAPQGGDRSGGPA